MANVGPNVWYVDSGPTIGITDLGSNNSATGLTMQTSGISCPAGSLVIACVNEATATSAGSLSDGTNSYTANAGLGQALGGSAGFAQIFYFYYATAQSSITLTYTKAGTGHVCAQDTFYASGIAASSSLDTAVSAVSSGTTTTPTVTSGTPSQSGDLIVGFAAWSNSTARTYAQQTAPPAFLAPPDAYTTQATASLGGGSFQYCGTTAVTLSPTLSGSVTGNALIIAGFKPASAPTEYYGVTPWAALTSYPIGTLIRQNLTPTVGNERVFVQLSTVTDVSGATEPTWVVTKGGKTTDATCTWQECTGQPAVNGEQPVSITTNASVATGGTGLTVLPTSSTSGVVVGMYCSFAGTTNSYFYNQCQVSSVIANTSVTLTNAANVRTTIPSGTVFNFSNTPFWYNNYDNSVALGLLLLNGVADTLFICTTAGTTQNSNTEPSFNKTAGTTTTDGTAVWTSLGAITNWTAKWAAPFPRLAPALATNWGVNGNTFYLGDDHAEYQSTATTLTSPGAACLFLCVNHAGSVPPVSADLRTTAALTENAAGNFVILLDGYNYGLNFTNGSSGGAIVVENGSPHNGTYEACSFASYNTIQCTSNKVTLFNTTFNFLVALGIGINVSGNVVWRNTASAVQGSVPTTLASVGTGLLNAEGVDFSALGGGHTVIGQIGLGISTLLNCKLGASVTVATISSAAGRVFNIVSDSAGEVWRGEVYDYAGTIVPSTTLVRTGGASDGITPISWNITTNANSNWQLTRLECLPIAIWNSTLNTNRGVTLYGLWNSATLPNNDQIWVDVEYFGSASSPLASLQSETKATVLATGVALTADSTSVWNSAATARQNSHSYSTGNIIAVSVSGGGGIFFCTSGGTSSGSQPSGYASAVDGGSVTDGGATFRAATRFALSVVLSSPQPQLVGYLRATVKAATASTTFYVDPLLNLS